MPRQVKIGFDKTPSPLVKQFPQLVDIRGTPLFDTAGNPLVTEDGASLASFNNSENSLSSFVANKGRNEFVAVEEQFPNESEVSSTLLGVPRAEEQLSLFSDVSTYGLDRSNWNYYTVSSAGTPSTWYNRKHPTFGNRGPARFYESTDEQALYLKSFPTQYTYPGHPRSSLLNAPDYTSGGPAGYFGKYLKFLALGRWLFEVWKDIDLRFAERNFISDCITFIDSNRDPIPFYGPDGGPNDEPNVWNANTGTFKTQSQWRTVIYTSDENPIQASRKHEEIAMAQIENWSLFYLRIRNDTDSYPIYKYKGYMYEFKTETDLIDPIPGVGPYSLMPAFCDQDNSRPGGSTNNGTTGILESRKSFRYQPGRVSGFTFGLRLKNNLSSNADKIEWGAANQTDQYMFQVSGTKFNIVRRSTLEIPVEVLEDPAGMDLTEQDQTGPEIPPSLDASQPMYTLTIPRDKWNGDPLDGSGPSGHIIKPENVTMYKIEYSWYGAIGAKFYAYIPLGNGECRWVRMHTLILENKLAAPVLANADFKFRYVLNNAVTSNLTEPTYIYKYGSSYYIDGGDEGTVTINSATSPTKLFSSAAIKGAVLGIHPKKKLFNSFGISNSDSAGADASYDGIDNNKKLYPVTLNVHSDNDIKVNIQEITVSPDGHHGSRSVDLSCGSLYSNDSFAKDITFNIIEGKSKISITDDSTNTLSYLDVGAKVIGDGLFNVYTKTINSGTQESEIGRKTRYEFSDQELNDYIKKDGTLIDFSNEATASQVVFSTKLDSFRNIVASDVPISANTFKVHFLNPNSYSGGYFRDFCIGVTPDVPSEMSDENGSFLNFGPAGADGLRVYPTDEPSDPTGVFQIRNTLHEEWTNHSHILDLADGADVAESFVRGPDRFEQDERVRGADLPFAYQISPGRYATKGVLSSVLFKVRTTGYSIESIDQLNIPADFAADSYRVVFTNGSQNFPPIEDKTIRVAEVGVGDVSTGYVYASKPTQILLDPADTESSRHVVYIEPPEGLTDSQLQARTTQLLSIQSGGEIQGKVVSMESDNVLYNPDNPDNGRQSVSRFLRQDVFQFNVQPLYLFFGMMHGSRINNIIVEEITEKGRSTHVPNFLGHNLSPGFADKSNVTLVSDLNVSSSNAPSNFQSEDRLSSANYDTSTTNPVSTLGETLFSFYVGENESVKFDLDNIFGADRKFLTPGLYNNKAIYFTVEPLEGLDGNNENANVQMTVTTKEQ